MYDKGYLEELRKDFIYIIGLRGRPEDDLVPLAETSAAIKEYNDALEELGLRIRRGCRRIAEKFEDDFDFVFCCDDSKGVRKQLEVDLEEAQKALMDGVFSDFAKEHHRLCRKYAFPTAPSVPQERS